MISVLKDERGLVFAYIEWYILDEKAQFKEGGEYVFVNDLWIHPDKRGGKTLRSLISDIHKNAEQTKYVYWKNEKHKERLTPTYSRARLSKLGV